MRATSTIKGIDCPGDSDITEDKVNLILNVSLLRLS